MRALALAAVVLLPGCLDAIEPDVGPPLRAVCEDIDSDPSTEVSYSADIAPLFVRTDIACLDCHAPNAPTPLGFEVGGLDLTSYAKLREGGAIAGADIVIPGQPCDSILLQKVGPAAPFGGRMPLDGPPFLSSFDQQLIHDWIAEGARDN